MKPWILFVIAIAPVLASGCSGCSEQGKKEIPAELVGVWKTSHPRYADRYFEIRTEDLIIGTGGQTSTTYPLTRFVSTELDTGTVYVIYYENEKGEESSMRMLYSEEGGGTLTDMNQTELIWRKEPE